MKKEITKFNLEILKGKKVVVHCKTKEQFQNFIDWVLSLGKDSSKDNYWEYARENSCLRLNPSLHWRYGSKNSYEAKDYKIISYEEALLKDIKKQKKSNKSKRNNFKKYGFKPITKKLEGKIYEEVICPRDKSTYYMGRVTNIYSDVPMAVEWDEKGVCSFHDGRMYDLVQKGFISKDFN